MSVMFTVIVISIVVVLFILALSIVTINKGYSYKHTVDPIDPPVDPAGKSMPEDAEK